MIRRLLLTGLCGSALGIASCDSKREPPAEVRVAAQLAPEPDANRIEVPNEAPSIATLAEFPFTEDASGKVLRELLAPFRPKSLEADIRGKPIEHRLPDYLADPTRMTRLNHLLPARLPNATAVLVRPHPLPDRAPDHLGGLVLSSPGSIRLPEGTLARYEASGDLKQPAPLPILGKPVPDRASLEDPTVDFTAKSVILETIPLRSEPDSFSKINLPDPFELRDTIRFRGDLPQTPDSMPISQNVPKRELK